jgi:hypothetical protein
MPATAPHIASFRKFIARAPDDHVRASVAFGLFLQSEQYWVSTKGTEPDIKTCCKYHENYLNDFQIQQFFDNATEHLNQFSNAVVGKKQADLLQPILAEQKKFSWKNVSEGVVAGIGAAGVWTVLLIFFSVVAQRNGIDLLEVYKGWAGSRQEQQHASPAGSAAQAPIVETGNQNDAVVNPEHRNR